MQLALVLLSCCPYFYSIWCESYQIHTLYRGPKYYYGPGDSSLLDATISSHFPSRSMRSPHMLEQCWNSCWNWLCTSKSLYKFLLSRSSYILATNRKIPFLTLTGTETCGVARILGLGHKFPGCHWNLKSLLFWHGNTTVCSDIVTTKPTKLKQD